MKDTRKNRGHNKAKMVYVVMCRAVSLKQKTINISIDHFFA